MNAAVAALRAVLPDRCILANDEETRPYECDGLAAYRQMPMIVLLPENEAQIMAAIAVCRQLNLPIVPLVPLAWGAELFGRLTGREPMLTRDALRMARHRMFFSSARAMAELGYRPRSYLIGVADALAWFRAQGMIA